MRYTQEDLKTAERHLAEAAQHIARQKQILGEAASDARALDAARQRLREFEAVQQDCLQRRDSILAEMSGRWRVDCLRGKFAQ